MKWIRKKKKSRLRAQNKIETLEDNTKLFTIAEQKK